MVRGLCSKAGPFELGDPCIRETWATLAPVGLVAVYLIASIPFPEPVRRVLAIAKQPFRTFLTLREAEALDAGAPVEKAVTEPSLSAKRVSLWRAVLLTGIALIETLTWMAKGSFRVIVEHPGAWSAARPFLVGLAWLYAAARPLTKPQPTPAYDLFALIVLKLIGNILVFGGLLYDTHLYYTRPSTLQVVGYSADLFALLGMAFVLLSTPIGIPSDRVKPESIGQSVSPEDYTSLWGWISFSWITPLVTRGSSVTLNEPDVWALSPTFQSRPLFAKFSQTKRRTLLLRIWAANSHDFILDFGLTFVSVVFQYAGPFFLKRILDAVGPEATRESRAQAHVFAVLALCATIAKAESDVLHLWLGRRAGTRTRSELMAAIYDKALKRKDFSGIVDKEKGKVMEPGKENEPKAGADVGKIVNLMASDAGSIAGMISSSYFMYGAPFEIIIASIFLYQLLGWSAFAGFLVLLVSWLLNSLIARRTVRIRKGVMAARDKRMGVLSELIGAVKFIKFFAWEDRWIERVLVTREAEMKWMVKARVNSIILQLLWTCAPILVSFVSFLTYVMLGNELTVATAFTAIALFNMIRQPLNIIPSWINKNLQTMVAVTRISTYLDEDEVTPQVSSLKADLSALRASDAPEGLGLDRATLKWNEVEQKPNIDDNKKGKQALSLESEVSSIVDEPDHRFELKDVSVVFPEGKLTLVTGPTASGKTALLMAVLGEMTLLEGRLILTKDTSKVDEHGLTYSLSYAAQMPWLRHQSIKDNILFGYPYDEERYNQVVECCALRTDLEILEDGDKTEIGARGVSLSGGQKARVALARAVYAHTKCVLLDDPLSAVDSHTARLLFERLLCGPLLANRTVILVTHHVELVLPGAHYVVRMLDGRIDIQGTVKDLRARGVLDEIAHSESADAAHPEPEANEVVVEAIVKEISGGKAPGSLIPQAKDVAKAVELKKPRKLIKDEKREEGSVKWPIYKTYLKASSYWTWIVIAVLIVWSQSLGVIEKFWIRTWGNAYAETSSTPYSSLFSAPNHEVPMDPHLFSYRLENDMHNLYVYRAWSPFNDLPDAHGHPLFYVIIYGIIGLATALVGVTSAVTQYTGALRASRILFKQLLVGVVRATMRWHDVTPQGRMLNRFSKDVETVDSSLAGSLQAVNSSLATFFAAIITVSVIFPLFLIPAIIIGFVYYQLAIGYLNTGRDLRRMESNSRSPIFSEFGELLEGIVTVRAFSAERRFLDGLLGKIDMSTQMWYNFWMMNRWLLLRYDVLGGIAVYIATLFALSGVVDSGLAGICITSAMAFTSGVYWACRFWTDLELDLNSVERLVEYLDLPQEPPAVIENNRVPAYWPSSSNKDVLIKVEDLVIKYAPDLPPVLHGISFQLGARERVGLLGRTGSGKSTLAMSLLRFVDPDTGRILIDDVDISTIGIHDLRSRLTFIPQDATLFSGTLRENLDPFNEHTDADCLDVLHRVHMIKNNALQSQSTSRQPSRAPSIREGVSGTEDQADEGGSVSLSSTTVANEGNTGVTLDTQVSAGGTNFSQGQRQLVAMARALLRRSSIIVLDEATSSIDFNTDAKIQATIRQEFNDSLLLTVAHRLKTVIDYDRLIVLDKGTIAEFDTPYNLLQKDDSIFRNMCLRSGMYAELEAAAKAKAEQTK